MELRAGPLCMLFEPETTYLRYVRLGDREIVRAIYGAVRDRNWGTITPRVADVQLTPTDAGFRLTFLAVCRQREIDFHWRGTITGDSDGTVTYTFDGTARSTFLRNRIGLCVLHSIRECAGAPCTVEHANGTVEQSAFPRAISPHQPFLDLRAISHTVAPGLAAEVRFSGDVFEMEDQRNWTDASFKTYSTPLRLPIPVEVLEGTRIQQSVTVRLLGDVPAGIEPPRSADPAAPGEHTIWIEEDGAVPLPRLGLGVASHGRTPNASAQERLRALRPAHLRVDLNLTAPGSRATLERAAGEARALAAALEAALFVSDAAERELRELVDTARELQPPIARWLVFHVNEPSTSEHWIRVARRELARFDPAVPLGSGTDVYFTQLNRGRPTPEALEALDLVCYSLNPQAHAFDDASLVETLEGQATTVESARQIAGGKPLAITPVTLRPRFNPDATGPAPKPAPGERPRQVDPRQPTRFCAAWTVGSLKQLAQDGVAGVTYFETTGERGIMADTEHQGTVFPVYHVLADAGEFAGGFVLPTRSSNPLAVEALALRHGTRCRVLLANLTPHHQCVRLSGAGLLSPGQMVALKLLDETSETTATQATEAFRGSPGQPLWPEHTRIALALPPHAVARLDWSSAPCGAPALLHT